MKNIAILFSSVLLALSMVACETASAPSDDGGIDILDSGNSTSSDGGNVVADSGTTTPSPTPDAGATPSPTPDAGTTPSPTPDAGTTPSPTPDAGLPSLDGGGLEEYSSVAEEGVLCGDSLEACAVGASCCMTRDGFSITAQCATPDAGVGVGQCAADDFEITCDDVADCGGGADVVCCGGTVLSIGNIQIQTTCMARSECAVLDLDDDGEPDTAEVCINSSECTGGMVCCGASSGLIDLPVDFGFCRDNCELSGLGG